MRYSLAKFLIFGLFSNYVLTSTININDQNDIENNVNNTVEKPNKNTTTINTDEKNEKDIDYHKNKNKFNNINYHDNSTNIIDLPYNSKPIQSILVQLANSDILSVEELDKIAKELAIKHNLPEPVQIGQLKGYYKFNISGSIHSNLQKRRIKRHIKRLSDSDEIVSWVDLDRTVHHSKRSISLSDFKDPLAHTQWNIVNTYITIITIKQYFYFISFYYYYYYYYFFFFFFKKILK